MADDNKGDASGAGGAGGGDNKGAGGAGGDNKGAGGNEPFYASWGLDEAGVKFINDRKFDGPKTIIQSAIESDRVARSRNVLEKPDPAKLGEWKGWTELGWIEDAGKYTITPPKEEKIPRDNALWDRVTKKAHELRVPLPALQALHDDTLAYATELEERVRADGAKAMQDTEKQLRAKWKGAEYDTNTELARRGAAALAQRAGVELNGDHFAALEQAVGGAPALIATFYEVGKLLGEDGLKGRGGDPAGFLTPEAARNERKRLEGDSAWMAVFNNPRHPQYEAHQARRNQLLTIEAKGIKAA